jgi:divalent metal cation (Fe/Co/Zn/Cd) transporter
VVALRRPTYPRLVASDLPLQALPLVHVTSPPRDATWLRRARLAKWLAWASLGWLCIEGGVGVAAGIIAGSVALVGFGLDSAIEGLASFIVVWRFTGTRTLSETSERTAQKLVAVSFFLLAPYVATESVHALLGEHHAETSVVGICLTAGTLVICPWLGIAKRRLGEKLGSAATRGEGTQNLLCAYLAAATLIGLVANTAAGIWWLDPLAGLFIAAACVRAGWQTWRGEDGCGCATCSAPPVP